MKRLLSAFAAASMLLGTGTAFAQGYAGAVPPEYATGWKAMHSRSQGSDALASSSKHQDTDRTVALQNGNRAAMSPSAAAVSRN
jgi:hypothetical protein